MKASRQFFGTAIAVTAVITAFNLSAAPLPEGGEVNPVPQEPVSGTKLAEQTTSFSSMDFSGELISTVLKDDASNPLGGLTFTYEIVLDAMPWNHGISRISLNSFHGFQTDVSYTDGTVGIGVPPVSADRTSDGAVVRFTFAPGDGLPSGENSALLVVQTDSAEYVESFASLLNGDIAKTGTYAPTLIPEPSMTALLLLGVGAFAFWNRRT